MRAFWLLLVVISSLSWSCAGDDARAWQAVQVSPSVEAIDSFLAKYPDSGYRQAAIQQKEDFFWKLACTDNTEYGYRRYKYDYPQGKYVDQVEAKISAIAVDAEVDFANLMSRRYSGKIDYGDKKEEILSLVFKSIEDIGTTVRFVAEINVRAGDKRKQLTGSIDKTTMRMVFEEQAGDEFTLNLPAGRAYWREGRLWLESVDPAVFWRLR